MGMSTHIIGFKPPDAKWKAMKEVWDACELAEIDPPAEVTDFFNGEPPDEAGVEVNLPHREWGDYDRSGVELDVADLPADVATIRFYNSW